MQDRKKGRNEILYGEDALEIKKSEQSNSAKLLFWYNRVRVRLRAEQVIVEVTSFAACPTTIANFKIEFEPEIQPEFRSAQVASFISLTRTMGGQSFGTTGCTCLIDTISLTETTLRAGLWKARWKTRGSSCDLDCFYLNANYEYC